MTSPEPVQKTTPTDYPHPAPPPARLNNKLFLIIGAAVSLILFSGAAYYLGTKGVGISLTTNQQKSQEQPAVNNPTITIKASQTPLFSGQLKKLSQNLKLFKVTEDDKLNGIADDSIYYEAGKFTEGELKDYFRVIAIKPPQMGSPLGFILATKDYQSYILDDPDNKTTKYPEDDWQNPYSLLDKNRIVSTKTFETEQPPKIDLNQSFSLYAEEFPTENVQTGSVDKNGNKIYETLLTTNFSSYQKLTSPFNSLTIYFKPYETNTATLKQKYLLGETEVIVVDSVGLPIAYSLTTPGNIKSYTDKLAQYNIAEKNYQDQLKKYQAKQITEYPQSPSYVYPPNMGFTGSQIASSQNSWKFYNNYQTIIPGACATALNSSIVNVTDSDLEQIGSVYNLPLYHLKNPNHSLYTLAFNNKMDYFTQDPTAWDGVNKGVKKPTLAEYINTNPLLFVKDYWGRFVGLGEFDIKLPGGCGKPVIYLYPQKPTTISVKFQAPMQFTTDIPTYADGWWVTAYPNGSLVNLKPKLTDCQQIDFQKKGAEYAREACQNNIYPYLYWAGNINSVNYPAINQGWVIEKNNLSTFLQTKLTEVGLSDKERNDFISYWLPEMMAKNTPYYRVSFLQTTDLNSLFPMTVSPNPDTAFRIFLDYSPLLEKPQNLPQPQILNKLIRSGFTLVEWGGLKQP